MSLSANERVSVSAMLICPLNNSLYVSVNVLPIQVAIVDENNVVIGEEKRSVMVSYQSSSLTVLLLLITIIMITIIITMIDIIT